MRAGRLFFVKPGPHG